MELSELTQYAEDKYKIKEEHKWADIPGFSVLTHPKTGRWIALLMRQWDTDLGMEIEHCDLKCGRETLPASGRPYLLPPVRMKGPKWVGVSFSRETEPDVVFRLFDRAYVSEQAGYTIVLESSPAQRSGSPYQSSPAARSPVSPYRTGPAASVPVQDPSAPVYQDTPLPFAGRPRPERSPLPEKLREMKRLYEYGRESMEAKAKNFCRQGFFMEDYTDDAPWTGRFTGYFPTYHELTGDQLRGYFAWRTHLRLGDFRPITPSAAYLYLYEILNGIGAREIEDRLEKLRAFERGFLDAGYGDARMRTNLRRWMLELVIVNGLPQELAEQYGDPEMLETDRALAVLRDPDGQPDEAVFSALCALGGKKTEQSPAASFPEGRGIRLFAEAWRKAASLYSVRGKDLFTQCFGTQAVRNWFPFSNAVYLDKSPQEDRTYVLNSCRLYRKRGGSWQVVSYEKLHFDKAKLAGFLHETDLLLRQYLKTGRYLKEQSADVWAAPYIKAVIEEEKRAVLEASRPKVVLNLSGLDKIRRDAYITQQSLLTEEDRFPEEPAEDSFSLPEEPASPGAPNVPLGDAEVRILQALLRGEPADGLLREARLMPSIAADTINEALFDMVGDTVLLCEDDRLSLVEDYIEDVLEILGGTS
ncbi:MAG: TerB N-terminal domain-containing protein [Lachnospiraceae bacterium]|nr:TerB N-terminal domain-containing protein [Lachnospiraceae bacterium]